MLQEELQGEYAGFASRALALSIDLFIISFSLLFSTSVINLLVDFLTINEALLTQVVDLLKLGIQLTLPVLYFIISTGLFDRTPGKALMGLRVIRSNGSPMTLWRATIRFVFKLLVTATAFLGYLWVLVDNKRRGWHDILARTYVIYSNSSLVEAFEDHTGYNREQALRSPRRRNIDSQ